MPEIHFTLRVANREAMRVPNESGYIDPWEWVTTTGYAPRHDDWVWIAAPGWTNQQLRARAGHAEHVPADGDVPVVDEPRVTIVLLLDTLSADDAIRIGVKHEDWMNG